MFKNMRIGTRILFGMSFSIFLMVIISSYSLFQIDVLRDSMNEINTDRIPKTIAANKIIGNINKSHDAILKLAFVPDSIKTLEYYEIQKKSEDIISKELDYLTKHVNSAKAKEYLYLSIESRKNYINFQSHIISELRKGNKETARLFILGDLEKLRKEYVKNIEDLIAFQIDVMFRSGVNAENISSQTFTVILSIALICVVISLIIVLLMRNSITKPINQAVDLAKRIANGDFSKKLEKTRNDELGDLIESMDEMATTISSIINDTNSLIIAVENGKLDQRGNSNNYSGKWADLVQKLNNLIDAFVKPINISAEYIDRISKGTIPPKITEDYYGDFNEMKNNLNQLISTLEAFTNEMTNMAYQHDLGEIDVFMDSKKFTGTYNEMTLGVNNLVKSNLNLTKMSIDIALEYGKGNFNAIMPEQPGKKAFIHEALNQLRANLLAVNKEITFLTDVALQGQLSTRANAEAFAGDWKQLISGLNKLVDSFVHPINETASYISKIAQGNIPELITEQYNGDLNGIKISINQLITNLNTFTGEVNALSKAANEGHLGVRGNATSFQGDWAKMLQIVNQLIDELLAPIRETISVLQEMAEGNLSVRMKGSYKGEHNLLKDNINTTLDLMPFTEAILILQKMANGDFRSKMTGNYKGDSLKLKVALNDTIDAIAEIILNVVNTVSQVTRGSMQVADASTALSQGATEQASSLEEITSSMSEIGSQTRTNAQNANDANKLTQTSKLVAEKGYNEMEELNSAMREITQSSQEISKIIKVIDEIAFQTNLLALNAAVEAARAGRHGKGFAVVADEVRNLAARSAAAAKETAELIANSIKSVGTGVNLANKTSEALDEIKQVAQDVFSIVNDIAQASTEQAQGIYQINEGLQQIDKVTQTNTASAEQSASAAEELSGQARNLNKLLQRFKVIGNSNLSYNQLEQNSLAAYNQSRQNNKALPHSSSKINTEHDELQLNPIDIIDLDNDDFGRY